MRKPKRAKLTIHHPNPRSLGEGDDGYYAWIKLVARNGQTLATSEMYVSDRNTKRGRAAIIRSMVDVLESEGFVVTKGDRLELAVATRRDG